MSWNQAHAPLLIESFPKTPRTRSEASWFGGSHSYKTKQITFLHRVNQPVIKHLRAQGRPNPRGGLVSKQNLNLFGLFDTLKKFQNEIKLRKL
jgi:hypothetical protein